MNDFYSSLSSPPVVIIVFAVLIFVLFIIFTVLRNRKNPYKEEYSQLLLELQRISRVKNQAKQAEWQRLISRWDNFIGRLLGSLGYMDESVNQRIRRAMESKQLDYEEFKMVKSFHLMRNQIMHEDKHIYPSDEQLVWAMSKIIKKLV